MRKNTFFITSLKHIEQHVLEGGMREAAEARRKNWVINSLNLTFDSSVFLVVSFRIVECQILYKCTKGCENVKSLDNQ